jgi:uncharacterized protein
MGSLTNIVRDVYASFAAGDLDGAMAHANADVVLTQDARLPWGGRYQGRDGIAEFGIKLATSVDTNVWPELFFEAGDTVIQQGRSRGRIHTNGLAYDVPECHVWTFEGNKVSNVQMFIESEAILRLLAS